MMPSDQLDIEAMENDRDDAVERARQLHADHPDLDASTILAALDDEFAGSSFSPSGSGSFVKKVDRIVHTCVNCSGRLLAGAHVDEARGVRCGDLQRRRP